MAARVVQKLNLTEHPGFTGARKSGFFSSIAFWRESEPVKVNPDSLALRIQGGVRASPVKGTNLVEITFVADSPTLAADIANGVAASYVEWNLESKFEVLGQASQFLSSQIEQLKSEIDQKAEQLSNYSDQKDIISLDSGSNVTMQKLEALNKDYAAAVGDRVSKEARYHETMTASPEAIADSTSGGAISQLRAEVSRLEREYAEKLNLYKPEWPAMQQLKTQIDKGKQHLREAISREVNKAREIARSDYLTAMRREQNLKAELSGQKGEAMTLNRNAVEYTNLSVEIQTKRELLDVLLQRQAETNVQGSLQGESVSSIRVVDKALPPGAPFKPNYRSNMLAALALGFGAGLLIVFMQEYLDRSLKSPEQVDRYLRLPALGVIPASSTSSRGYGNYGYFSKGRQKKAATAEPGTEIELLPHKSRRSTIAEAYRAFRTSLLLSQAGGVRSVVITSCLPSEGKTSTAMNLAIVLSQLGRSVLLIDADLHKPRLHEVFRVSNRKGLVSVLAESEDPTKVITQTIVQGVYLMPAGPSTPNPSGLLASKPMARFLEIAREKFNHVIIDTPPISPISDALILGHQTDGIVLCVKAGTTPRDLVARVRDDVYRSNVRILGVLLNNLQVDESGYYGKYQYYARYYGGSDKTAAAGGGSPFIGG
jgi:polysaccharide biosynthesis transport protein